jgi:hypothetical protein
MRNIVEVIGKPIAVFLQSISGVSAVNSLVAFYDIHGRKREVLFFYFVPDTENLLNLVTFKFLEFIIYVYLEYIAFDGLLWTADYYYLSVGKRGVSLLHN